MEFYPTYDTYRRILTDIKATGKIMDYVEAKNEPMFIVLRHDIEFSVERAMSMSLIESAMDICSTYFVQIRSNAYNAFSLKNIDMLRDMHQRGHHIGLHYHIGESMDPVFVTKEIAEQCDMLEIMLGIPVDRYSMHRPQKETGYFETDISGKLNAYGSSFFTYAEDVDASAVLNVKYISDAKHRWNYGTPDAETLHNAPRIQLLIHPDFWSEDTPDMRSNFGALIRDHSLTFTDTMDNECHHFGEFRDGFESIIDEKV